MPVGGREQETLATGQCFEESVRGIARGAHEFRHVHLERSGDELVVLLATHLDARSRASELDRVRVDLVVDGREQRFHVTLETLPQPEWLGLRPTLAQAGASSHFDGASRSKPLPEPSRP